MNTDELSKKSIPLNIQLSHYDKEMLEALKKDTGKGMGTLLREYITARYRMRYNNEPTCADCTACKCPHMHQVQPAKQITNAELLAQEEEPNGTAET